ncbi:hypothetical protein EYF80_010935 [Liparis tanakae]|uniref:Uncharacterized protein n=1 Tax=Liparis tanakae TaxID=230148 RepID=A0A4Z2ILN9_9TELE|nr:hypothetical protein EYF80_010935 [Liparis tanakae]
MTAERNVQFTHFTELVMPYGHVAYLYSLTERVACETSPRGHFQSRLRAQCSPSQNIKQPSGGLCAGEVVNRYGTDGRLRFTARNRFSRPAALLWLVDGKPRRSSQDACRRSETLHTSHSRKPLVSDVIGQGSGRRGPEELL